MLLTGDEARLFYPQLMGVGGGSLIFLTTKEAIRRGIAQSELRLNLLRICAREPHTIHDLIHAPEYPGIKISLFSIQAEINVSVELGELKSRMLLVRVGRVPDPVVPQGTTELLRTSLLAFLLSPELCWAEPAAYELYLRSWLSQNGLNEPAYLALFPRFPCGHLPRLLCGLRGIGSPGGDAAGPSGGGKGEGFRVLSNLGICRRDPRLWGSPSFCGSCGNRPWPAVLASSKRRG